MSKQLQQAKENLDAAQCIMTEAILALGEAFKLVLEDQMPEVPDDDTMASLGRFGEAK